MDIKTFDELLKTLSEGSTIDHEQWSALQSRIISRLERICQVGLGPEVDFGEATSSFEVPSSPFQVAESSSQKSSSSTDKENAPPHSNTKPPHITVLLNSITCTLNTFFSKHPPHTVQRLAELIQDPRRHYKTLNSYLHAVDRVVQVTSGAHIFPLPPAVPDPSSTSVLSNGDPAAVSWGNPATQQNGLGSDESLGGALLTPISWLTKNLNGNTHSPLEGDLKTESTEMIDGPNGMGGIETVTVSVNGISSTRGDSSLPSSHDVTGEVSLRAEGGVTQGELLRQEQRAGVVPVTQLNVRALHPDGSDEEDGLPHARGPEEIGVEDTGLQPSGNPTTLLTADLDVDAATGRKSSPTHEFPASSSTEETASPPSTPKRDAEDELESSPKRLKDATDEENMDQDPAPEYTNPENTGTDSKDEDTAMPDEISADKALETKEPETSDKVKDA